MAAGGFREFVAGEVLDEDEINDFLMQGVLVFAGTAARGSAITSPVEGQFAFLKDNDQLTFYDGSDWVEFVSGPTEFNFLVIAGGGPGGMGGWAGGTLGDGTGGGGAGGYRCSVSGESSGGSTSAEDPLYLGAEINYTVTVGAGGVCPDTLSATNPPGGNSVFGPIFSYGGGAGAARGTNDDSTSNTSGPGASSGGAISFQNSALRLVSQGSRGGSSTANNNGGGGGGAGGVGSNGVSSGGGGAGLASSITGSSVTRAVGGDVNTGGTNGTVNTGNGGGSASFGNNVNGGNGGSGVVIIKYPDTITLTIGAGLTSSTSSAGGFKVTTFTAGTDVISF